MNKGITNKTDKTVKNDTQEAAEQEQLLMKIDEATKESPKKSSKGEEKEYTKEELVDLLKAKGPEGISFANAVTKRKKAVKTIDRLTKLEELSGTEMAHLLTAKKIVKDKELGNFIEAQIHYRNLLGIKPQTKEENDRKHKANEIRKAPLKDESSQKRKLSDPEVKDSKIQATLSRNQPNTSKKVRVAVPSTSKVANKEIEALRMALVDLSNDDGKLEEDIRNQVEIHILTTLPKKENCKELFCEAGWARGHRIFDCINQASADFLKEAVDEMKLKDRKLKIIPYAEINTVRQPRGWIWAPKPYISQDLLLQLVKAQNPDYNTGNWSIVSVGAKKQLGQHFLIKMTKEDVEKLKTEKMMLRVGFFQSNVVMDGESQAATEEVEVMKVN